MQLVSEASTNPRINGPKVAAMSRLHSITPPELLVGGATDPMKGECECIDLARVKQAFCNRCVNSAWKDRRLHLLSGHDDSAKSFPRSMSRLGRRRIRFKNAGHLPYD
jgi:hypothetical protein